MPVAKVKSPKTLNDYRPVVLIPLIMKPFEHIKGEIMAKIQEQLEPLQFAYRVRRGVEDTTATLLNYILKHLEGSTNYAGLYFKSKVIKNYFNYIQPHVWIDQA